MKITRFLKIKSYRIFRDFSWPNGLLPFARYNLFYGWNGSGKSTLSSVFTLLQRKEALSEGEVIIETDGTNRIQGSQFDATATPPTRVFNRHFVDNTLVAIRNAKAQPIFYLGQQSVEEAQVLSRKRGELVDVKAELMAANTTVSNATRDVEKYATSQARNVKTMFSGCRAYLTFDRRRFIDCVERIKALSNPLQALTEEEKASLHIKQRLQPKSDVYFSGSTGVDVTSLVRQVCEMLSQTVVSAVIDKLANDPPLARWVQEGLALHSGTRHTLTCQFCGNIFADETRHQFEAHFNDAYTRFQSVLQSMVGMIKARLPKVDVSFPADSAFYDNLQDEYKDSVFKAKQTNEKLKSILGILLKALEDKKSRPFEQMRLQDILEQNRFKLSDVETLEAQLLDEYRSINLIVQKHNNQTQTIERERESAYVKLVDDFLLATISEYDQLKSAEQAATNSRDELQTRCDTLDLEISEIERRLIESRRPVEELNNELHSYLGRDELSFELEDAGYKLLRSGHVADNLSEGECTAITFLYFLKTLSDRNFDKGNGIVVIDDPVSSLDDNALFSAFAYMKERVKDCGQLFILTHNFSFFRQVRNWMFNMHGPLKREKRYYSIMARKVNSLRSAVIAGLDPLLLQFESEYHFLFKVLSDVANSSGDEALACYYNIPNMARRLLESFLAHYVPNRQGELFHKMENIQYDGAIKTRILRLLNFYSHMAVASEPGHDPTVLSETQDVIRELLEMIKALDENHYNGMVSLISTNTSATSEDNP